MVKAMRIGCAALALMSLTEPGCAGDDENDDASVEAGPGADVAAGDRSSLDHSPRDSGEDVPVDAAVIPDSPAMDADAASAGDGGAPSDAVDVVACLPRRCGQEIACGVAADGCGNSVTCEPCPDVGRSLRLPGARHMVVDPHRRLFYVTMPGTHPDHPNSVVVVAPTPTMPRIVTSLAVGAEPNVLALSEDGSRLWVGIDGEFAIRKVNLGSGMPVLDTLYRFATVVSNANATTWAAAMKTLRGRPDSVIVSLSSGNNRYGVVVLDDGVARGPATVADANSLAVGRDDDVFAVSDSIPTTFYSLKITGQGVTKMEFPRINNTASREIVYGHDRVYSLGGDVIDVSTPSAPVHRGMLPAWGLPRPLPADPGRVLRLGGAPGGADTILRTIDVQTLTATRSVSIAETTNYDVRDVDLLGADTIVFLAVQTPGELPTRLVVARTSLLP